MNQRELKYWALLKWRYIVQNDGELYGLVSRYPELRLFKSQCSYCSHFLDNGGCYECPLGLDGIGICNRLYHPYDIWRLNRTPQNAQALLDLIKSIKVPTSKEEPFFRKFA